MALIKCEECGKQISNKAEICPHCGNPMKDKNDNDISPKNSNVKTGLIIGIILSVIIIIIMIFVIKKNEEEKRLEYEQQVQQEISDYYLTAFALYYNISDNGVKIEEIGNDISSYWYDYIYKGKYKNPDDAIKKALNKNSKKVKEIDETNERIERLYSESLNYPKECNHCNEIKTEVEKMYNLYNNFYSSVFYASGTYSDFQSAISKSDTELANEYKVISSKLDMYKD